MTPAIANAYLSVRTPTGEVCIFKISAPDGRRRVYCMCACVRACTCVCVANCQGGP